MTVCRSDKTDLQLFEKTLNHTGCQKKGCMSQGDRLAYYIHAFQRLLTERWLKEWLILAIDLSQHSWIQGPQVGLSKISAKSLFSKHGSLNHLKYFYALMNGYKFLWWYLMSHCQA